MSAACPSSRRGWPLERVLFALAGTVTLISSRWPRWFRPGLCC